MSGQFEHSVSKEYAQDSAKGKEVGFVYLLQEPWPNVFKLQMPISMIFRGFLYFLTIEFTDSKPRLFSKMIPLEVVVQLHQLLGKKRIHRRNV